MGFKIYYPTRIKINMYIRFTITNIQPTISSRSGEHSFNFFKNVGHFGQGEFGKIIEKLLQQEIRMEKKTKE